jgi:exodeoxyribonuclease VII large subunit
MIRGLANPAIVGVKTLSDSIKRKLMTDDAFKNIGVRGEISNVTRSAKGHAHFDLKEGENVLHCFAWEDDAHGFPQLKQGSAVVAVGSISTYPLKSSYQLVVRRIELEGIGDIHALFEARKKKLAAEGLFESARKRPMPAFPFRVALVSSRRADGARDFVTRLRKQRPHVRVTLVETSVQGPRAPAEIAGALARASQLDVDLIVLTRGGGSFEDLFTFSDETVVRAVARAKHPVLSAIGHTVDQQLSDFVADFHAETPSAAAERIGPETNELLRRVTDGATRMERVVELGLQRARVELEGTMRRSKLSDASLLLLPQQQRLEALEERLAATFERKQRERTEHLAGLGRTLGRFDPSLRLAERQRFLENASLRLAGAAQARLAAAVQRANDGSARLAPAFRGRLEREAQRLSLVSARLDGNDPEAILQRGYAIVTGPGGAIVRDPGEIEIGSLIAARVARGTLSARVEEKETYGNERVG